jgi:DNA-binding NarL/FixJ family response regulator
VISIVPPGTSVRPGGSIHLTTMLNWPAPRIALIERQSLFTPFLRETFESNGALVSLAGPRPTAAALRRLDPDVVCIDVDQLETAPLLALRALRRTLPGARIVAYASLAEPLWIELALSVGADAVLGPQAGVRDLLEAVQPPLAA